ncbi:hypothetical protein [Rhizobium leguminosarum]|uniref:hypothetical protein n=1 Tax=Rhizobium leguminosarum TaxID=384 RepID=UPI003F9B87B1
MDDCEKKEGATGAVPTQLGVVWPEPEGQATLTAAQEEIINAYRAGRMDEVQFQRHLTDDPVIAEYVPPHRAPARRSAACGLGT